MYCTKCGKETAENAKFCAYCGNSLEQFSRIIPIWKFILLCVITFGLYELFWFYKTWKFLKEKNNLDISPFWRTVFSGLYAGSNAKHVLNLAKGINYQKEYSPTLIGISYIILNVLWRLPDPYWLLSIFSFLPMIPIVKAMNFYWQNKNPNLPLKKFPMWQVILIILGIIFLILMLIGIFIPEQENVQQMVL